MRRVERAFIRTHAPLKEALERNMLLNAQLLYNANLLKPILRGLHSAEYRVFSQWGEDGIIAWLTGQLEGIPRTFVEFGVDNYQESNTRYLLQSQNWRGLVFDGSRENINDLNTQDFFWRHDLRAAFAFIDRDNINALISENGFIGDLGLLSIDLDGNDYWVWDSIDVVAPIIVICEYNAVLGDQFALTVPYEPGFKRSAAHYSNIYFGASLKALIKLSSEKGYTFVGTTSTGCNAFFVRNDYAACILDKLERILMFPSLFREARNNLGLLQYISGSERTVLISDLPFLNIATGVTAPLAEYGALYSYEWSQGLPCDYLDYALNVDLP